MHCRIPEGEGEGGGEGGKWVRTVHQTVGERVDAVHHYETWESILISQRSVPIALVIFSMNEHIMLAPLYPIHVYHAPLLLLLFMFIPHRRTRMLHRARETYQQRKKVPLAPLCMPLASGYKDRKALAEEWQRTNRRGEFLPQNAGHL